MMARILVRLARLVATLGLLVAAALIVLPPILGRYSPFLISAGPRFQCPPPAAGVNLPTTCGRSLEAAYSLPLDRIVLEAAERSLVLVVGAAILAFTVGLLLGAAIALARHRAWRSGALLGGVGLLAAVPSFFVAYFLQIVVIFLGGALGRTVLPVFGFGLDAHVVLPLVAVALPAIAATAQLASTRFADVLDSDFVRTAEAKGLWPAWILRTHVLPHVLPLGIEAVGGGLRISVASLPIVEYLFVWNGLGYLSVLAVASKDEAGLIASLVILATLFSLAGLLADARRLRA